MEELITWIVGALAAGVTLSLAAHLVFKMKKSHIKNDNSIRQKAKGTNASNSVVSHTRNINTTRQDDADQR